MEQLRRLALVLGRLGIAIAAGCFLVIYLPAVTFLLVPFLLLAVPFRSGEGRRDEVGAENNGLRHAGGDEASQKGRILFDRRTDVPKLYGSNTRNVAYRWDLFRGCIERLLADFGHPNALDFGAGSLRETYELARLGFNVTSFDCSKADMEASLAGCSWEGCHAIPKLTDLPLGSLAGHTYHLVLAFDVLEHLQAPAEVLVELSQLLHEQGCLLVSVPNGRSLWERHFRRGLLASRRKGKAEAILGAEHLQFHSPAGWAGIFVEAGFDIAVHDMTVGFLVNDVYHGVAGMAYRQGVAPILQAAVNRLGLSLAVRDWEETLCYPAWLMRWVNRLDLLLKPLLARHWGWGLFVLVKGHPKCDHGVSARRG